VLSRIFWRDGESIGSTPGFVFRVTPYAPTATFVELTLAPVLPGSAFVNADEIAKQRWPDLPATDAHRAAGIAAQTRTKLIELGESFIADTPAPSRDSATFYDDSAVQGPRIAAQQRRLPRRLPYLAQPGARRADRAGDRRHRSGLTAGQSLAGRASSVSRK
jgi:hypothetical protein